MEAYAVLETGGKQTLVRVGDKIEIEKLSVEAGQDAVLTTVCAVSDGTTLKVGAPYVEGASVTLTVDGVIRGKKVLVIDDILDTGNTMFGIKQALVGMGAKEIKTCVLLDKPARRTADITADFAGFEIENKFVVGYGLDYAGDYRTFPEIWTMEEDDGK